MNQLAEFLVKHGYWVLFVAVICRQACLPVPTNLLLLVAGALVGVGRLNPVTIVLYTIPAFILADLAWYEAGRRWGTTMLHFLCRTSLNPQICVDKMVGNFNRLGARSLLVSKFVIGLDSITSPLSGISGVRRGKFLFLDGIGALIWVLAYLAAGYSLKDHLNHVAAFSSEARTVLAIVGLGVFLVLLIGRLNRWYRFLREFRLDQITPDQLKDKLKTGAPVLLLDLQGDMRRALTPSAIPGAVRIDPRKLQQYLRRYRDVDVRTNREVILYSSSSSDSMGARVAIELRRRGFERVRPLAGGLRAWHDRGFPITSEIEVLPAAEHAVFVLLEILRHSRESVARFLGENAVDVDRILERARMRIRRWHIADKPSLIEYPGKMPRDIGVKAPARTGGEQLDESES
jgi:membrane protein DedA with SNARE-associated domain/rhodanese-related sulfurtransferase